MKVKPIESDWTFSDEVEQELAAGLGERQIAELIEDDEVHAGAQPSCTSLAATFCADIAINSPTHANTNNHGSGRSGGPAN